jgi:Gas vesicle synthesis protein GvpL/GvpF
VIRLYALVEGLADLPAARGVAGERLERRTIEGLTAIVGEAAADDPGTDEQAVLRHARVVDELFARSAALLPARYGRGFADEAALAAAVRDNASELHAALARVRGCVELGVRALAAAAPEPARRAATGREYMQSRLGELGESERLALELHGTLARGARASERNVELRSRFLLSASYLVPSEDVETFRREVQSLQTARPDLSIVCTGPWPPYSFTNAPEAQA